MAQTVESLPAMWETWVWSLGREDPLEKEMAISTPIFFPGKIPGTEKTGRVQSMGSQRVEYNWMTNTFTFLSHLVARGKKKFPFFFLEEQVFKV